MVREIILWCQTSNISLTAVHISGCDNVEADRLSRHRVEHPRHLERSTEWSLDQEIANLLFDLWGLPIVDLFATRLNTKVEAFYARLPDPLALPGNPLQVDWSQGLLYMYAPQPLLSLALHKVIREEAQVIAIIPWWPRRGWFPLVLQLLVDLPVLLPEVDGLLVGGDGVFHPNLHELRLAAWRLSGDLSAGEAFRERLQQPSAQLIDSRRAICTTPSGGPFLAGVLERVRIPFTHLSGQFCPTYST